MRYSQRLELHPATACYSHGRWQGQGHPADGLREQPLCVCGGLVECMLYCLYCGGLGEQPVGVLYCLYYVLLDVSVQVDIAAALRAHLHDAVPVEGPRGGQGGGQVGQAAHALVKDAVRTTQA